MYSASRRTDMAAFFPDALVEKVKRSRRLEGMVVWTKDIRNLVCHIGLSGVVARVPTVVQYTVTGLAGSVWEPRVPPLEQQLSELAALAKVLPAGAICWRFDPIFPTPDMLERFRRVRRGLESVLGPLDRVTVSFPDPYRHAVVRAAAAGLEWPVVGLSEKRRIIAELVKEFDGVGEGKENFRPLRLCCEPTVLSLCGVAMAQCIDGALFERLYGLPLANLPKDEGQRKACGCVKSTDIGAYAMRCGHGCLYCYANPG